MTYIIAEIGTSHQGSLVELEKLIKAARDSGADCAKFQWVIAHEIVHPLTGVVPLPTGNITIYDRFKELELPKAFYQRAKELCQTYKIDFLCTPFGPHSASGLHELGAQSYKIASPELNYQDLVKQIVSYKMPIFVSSGVSTLSDIDETLSLIGDLSQTTLLHCITSYPAPESDFNLMLIRSLSEVFGVKTGLSDHSLHPYIVPLIAVALGAQAIEKHFTLSNDTDGLDDPIALNPTNFKKMVEVIRQFETSSFAHEIALERKKEKIAGLLNKFFTELGHDLSIDEIVVILGDGKKKLAASEFMNYGRTNRSIHALNDLPLGHVLKASDFACLRTEKILRPGLHPRYSELIIGRRLSQAIPSGEGIRWEDLQ